MVFNLKNKLSIYSTLLSALILGSYFYVTPYISILRFKWAIENQNSLEAENYINFPSVRSSLKGQMKIALKRKTEHKVFNTPLGPLTMIVINPILNKVVDATVEATVTPSGLGLLLKRGKVSTNTNTNTNTVKSSKSKLVASEDPKISLYYKNFNEFVLRTDLPSSRQPLLALWIRENLINWRLFSIDLPDDLIEDLI